MVSEIQRKDEFKLFITQVSEVPGHLTVPTKLDFDGLSVNETGT